MYLAAEFESSSGRTYDQLPPNVQTEVTNFTRTVDRWPGVQVTAFNRRAAQSVEINILKATISVELISQFRYNWGIRNPERFTIRTPDYTHTIDFAKEAPPESGEGPFWTYSIWTSYFEGDSFTIVRSSNNYSSDHNLSWPYKHDPRMPFNVPPPTLHPLDQRGIILDFRLRTPLQQQAQPE